METKPDEAALDRTGGSYFLRHPESPLHLPFSQMVQCETTLISIFKFWLAQYPWLLLFIHL